jgi:hypothetical protein
MNPILIRNGRVVIRDNDVATNGCQDCCGPAAAEGYYGATPCSNVCDPSIAPPVLYIPVSVAAGLAGPVFGTLAGCYQIDYSVLYWDCVFRGPPPPFGVGVPPYICAPLDFYRPVRRYAIGGPPLRSFSGCAECFDNVYRQSSGPPICPGDNTFVHLYKCVGCNARGTTTALPPPEYEGILSNEFLFDLAVPWINVRQVLQDSMEVGDGCKSFSYQLPGTSTSPLGYIGCLSVDVRFEPSRFRECLIPGSCPNYITGLYDSCCACHAAISTPDVVGGAECLTGGTAEYPLPGLLRYARPRCAPGVRPDWSLAYRCPPQVPIGKPCCCPGTPCHRRLRIRAKRVDTVISTGNTTVQVWAGWAPGVVRNWALYSGSTQWSRIGTFSYPSHPACDPMALFQLLGRAGECGDPGFEVELAVGNCWTAAYIESRTNGDNYTRIEYYAAFDTQGDGFPFLPELDDVPGGIQSTVGLLGVPMLGVPNQDIDCVGIPQLQYFDDGTQIPKLRETTLVDGNIRASWLACQDGCSGGGGALPEPGRPGGPFGPGLLRSGGGCGGCGADGGL